MLRWDGDGVWAVKGVGAHPHSLHLPSVWPFIFRGVGRRETILIKYRLNID